VICTVIKGLYFFIFPDLETRHQYYTITALQATHRCQKLLDTDSDCSTEQAHTYLFGLIKAKGPIIAATIEKKLLLLTGEFLGPRNFEYKFI